jgi:hypothetical protein
MHTFMTRTNNDEHIGQRTRICMHYMAHFTGGEQAHTMYTFFRGQGTQCIHVPEDRTHNVYMSQETGHTQCMHVYVLIHIRRAQLIQRTHINTQGHSVVIDEAQAICGVCSKASIFPFITPCGHLICIGCLELPVSACTVCAVQWSFGRFAAFQPSVEQANISWNDAWVETVSTKVCMYVCMFVRMYGCAFMFFRSCARCLPCLANVSVLQQALAVDKSASMHTRAKPYIRCLTCVVVCLTSHYITLH